MRVVAIISAYNEADIIAPVLDQLIREGVAAYLLDHGSTDGTAQIASSFLDRGLLAIEPFPGDRFPAAREAFSWTDILIRKTELAAQLDADWFIHHDADEFRESPWEGLSLTDAIARVDRFGYNAIDFQVFNFRPGDEPFHAGDDPRAIFRRYEAGGSWDKKQVKCWKKQPVPVDLVSSGGHDVSFPDRRVFPMRFILRHYPIRSAEHGRRKLLVERRPRFLAKELQQGWHVQYDNVPDDGDVFRRDATLREYDGVEARLTVMLRHRVLEGCERASEQAAARIDQLEARASEQERRLQEREQIVAARLADIQWLSRQVSDERERQRHLTAALEERDRELRAVYASKTWRWTTPLRELARFLAR